MVIEPIKQQTKLVIFYTCALYAHSVQCTVGCSIATACTAVSELIVIQNINWINEKTMLTPRRNLFALRKNKKTRFWSDFNTCKIKLLFWAL